MPSNRTFQMRYLQFRVFTGFNAPRSGIAVRSHYRPQADIFRACAVGIVAVAALLTTEAQALAVGRRDVTTFRTSPRCVSWVDQLRSDSNRSSFVCNKELSLGIRPAVNFGTEFLPLTQQAVSYVRQVFQADRSCVVRDSVGYQLFRRAVEDGYRYGSFMAAHASEETPRAFGANELDSRAFAADTRTAVVFHPSLEKECSVVRRVGIDHQAFDSEVATEVATLVLRSGDLNFVSEAQNPHLAHPLHLGIFPANSRDVRVLQDDRLAENSHALFVLEQIPLVGQRNRGAFVDAQIPFAESLQSLVARRHLAEQGAGQLRRDTELLTDDGIESTGESIGVQCFGVEHLLGNPSSGSKESDRHSIEMLRLSGLDFDRAD